MSFYKKSPSKPIEKLVELYIIQNSNMPNIEIINQLYYHINKILKISFVPLAIITK